jgi:hypothetical protein
MSLSVQSAVLQQDISVRNIGLLTSPNATQGQANKAVGAIIERVEQQQLNERDRATLTEIRQLNDKSVPVTDEAIGGIDQTTQQNAALVEQAAAAAESLKDQTRSLNDAVAIFKTDASSRAEAALF